MQLGNTTSNPDLRKERLKLPCKTHKEGEFEYGEKCEICKYDSNEINKFVKKGIIYFYYDHKIDPFVELCYIPKSLKNRVREYNDNTGLLYTTGGTQGFTNFLNTMVNSVIKKSVETTLIPCASQKTRYDPPSEPIYDFHCLNSDKHFLSSYIIKRSSRFYITEKGLLIQKYRVNKIYYYMILPPSIGVELDGGCNLINYKLVLGLLFKAERLGRSISKLKASSRMGLPYSENEIQFMNEIITKENERRKLMEGSN